MKTFLLTICFLSVQTGMVAIAQDKEQTPVYLDDTQPIEVRVQDALNRMTVEEKTRLSYAQGKFSSPGCPRLGIPELWMSDGPHGVRAEINWNDWGYAGWTNDSCTAFPALTCLAASWNPLLAAKYGYAIGEEARYRVHQDRNRYYGIMVGIGTVLRDDPLLNCRIPEGRHPVRIICDSSLRTPVDSQIVRTADKYPTIIATCCKDEGRHSTYKDAGCKIITVPETEDRHVDLIQLMDALGGEKIDSILLEGGSRLNWSALDSGIVNKVQVYIAPKIFGGAGAPSPVGGQGVPSPDKAFRLSEPEISFTGQDILLESEVLGCSQE